MPFLTFFEYFVLFSQTFFFRNCKVHKKGGNKRRKQLNALIYTEAESSPAPTARAARERAKFLGLEMIAVAPAADADAKDDGSGSPAAPPEEEETRQPILLPSAAATSIAETATANPIATAGATAASPPRERETATTAAATAAASSTPASAQWALTRRGVAVVAPDSPLKWRRRAAEEGPATSAPRATEGKKESPRRGAGAARIGRSAGPASSPADRDRASPSQKALSCLSLEAAGTRPRRTAVASSSSPLLGLAPSSSPARR